MKARRDHEEKRLDDLVVLLLYSYIFMSIQCMRLEKRVAMLSSVADFRTRLVLTSGLLFYVAQFSIFWYLTYYELSWDVMEPVAYLWAIGVEVLALGYFMFSRRELHYEGLYSWIYHRWLRSMLDAEGLDSEDFHDVFKDREVALQRLSIAKRLTGR
jgi:calcium uniporter protein, mitochondrial